DDRTEGIDRARASVSSRAEAARTAGRQALTGRGHHLGEERLFDCYLSEQAGEPADPPAAEHLFDCGECCARYGDLVQFMDGLRAEADTDSDRIFTADRLRAQQQQILRRIQQLGRPARIINFPSRLMSRTMNATAAHG